MVFLTNQTKRAGFPSMKGARKLQGGFVNQWLWSGHLIPLLSILACCVAPVNLGHMLNIVNSGFGLASQIHCRQACYMGHGGMV
jgi:hypothetical protein